MRYKPIDDLDVPAPIFMPGKKQLAEVNGLFDSYVFYQESRDNRVLTTSCCRKEGVVWPRVQREMDDNILKISFGKAGTGAVCPYCGSPVTLKNINRLGKRKALSQYMPVVFLNYRKGKLYASAYWFYKGYENLTALPKSKCVGCYEFDVDKRRVTVYDVAAYEDRFYSPKVVTEYNPAKLVADDPFRGGNGYYCSRESYRVIGIKNIDNGLFRYSCYDKWFSATDLDKYYHSSLIRYLALYSLYPRNVEMMMKADLKVFIDYMIYGRRKNASLIKWGVDDPLESFGLTRKEFRDWIEVNRDIDVLNVYKRISKFEGPLDIKKSEQMLRDISLLGDYGLFFRLCRKYKLKPSKVYRYLNKSTGPRCHGAYFGFRNAFELWKDLVSMNEYLGYDNNDVTVIMPKNLDVKHNEAAAEQSRRLELERVKKNKAEMRRLRKLLNRRNSKYNFDYGDLMIYVAPDEEAVIAEGKALSHCVGGYASRHVQGKTTILFLRKKDCPDAPYVTVEMQGNKLIQAHGFKNERDGDSTPPRERHKEFFDTWLAWVGAGSKRDDEGSPIVPSDSLDEKKKVA